jgi:antitoxin component YwqK of YwqJK toxin-antitoxin module
MSTSGRILAITLAIWSAAACSERTPRNLDSLVERDGRYLDPENFRPYSGPVVATFDGAPEMVELEAELAEGRLDGPYERFYRSGVLFGRGEYRMGAWHGAFESFYEDGTLWMSGRYEDGQLDGPYTSYAEDGSIVEQGSYAAGAPCGAWTVEGTEEVHAACP